MIRSVVLSPRAQKQVDRAPAHIAAKLFVWMDAVEEDGLEEVRRIPGYHDEPLKGKRKRQRSIRLSRAWRAICEVNADGEIEFAIVEEVTKHGY